MLLRTLASLLTLASTLFIMRWLISGDQNFDDEPKVTCMVDSDWTISSKSSISIRDGGFKFQADSLIYRRLCGEASLKVTLPEQTVVGGSGPEIGVSIGKKTLLVKEIRRAETLNIPINEPGLLGIAFLNDYYRSEARVIEFTQVRYTNSDCRVPQVKVPQPNLGGWYETARSGTLVSAPITTFTLCGIGTLSMQLKGSAAGGQAPILRITLDGKVIREMALNETQNWSFKAMKPGKIGFQLMNPYTKELADRNLVIDNIQLIKK